VQAPLADCENGPRPKRAGQSFGEHVALKPL